MNDVKEKVIQETSNLFVGALSPIRFNDPGVDPSLMLHHLNLWSNLIYVDSVILPSQVRTILNTTFRNASSDVTIMDLWRKANPHIVYVDSVFERDEVKLNCLELALRLSFFTKKIQLSALFQSC